MLFRILWINIIWIYTVECSVGAQEYRKFLFFSDFGLGIEHSYHFLIIHVLQSFSKPIICTPKPQETKLACSASVGSET